MKARYLIVALLATFSIAPLSSAFAANTAKDMILLRHARVDLHKYPRINRVYDVNYDSPKKLNALVHFIENVNDVVPGKAIVVIHGAEIRGFAKENYKKYHTVIDKLFELSRKGVQFRMCNNAMHAAGFKAKDIDGFITIIPAGFAEIIYLEHKGYEYINASATPVFDSRYIDHPEERPKS